MIDLLPAEISPQTAHAERNILLWLIDRRDHALVPFGQVDQSELLEPDGVAFRWERTAAGITPGGWKGYFAPPVWDADHICYTAPWFSGYHTLPMNKRVWLYPGDTLHLTLTLRKQ